MLFSAYTICVLYTELSKRALPPFAVLLMLLTLFKFVATMFTSNRVVQKAVSSQYYKWLFFLFAIMTLILHYMTYNQIPISYHLITPFLIPTRTKQKCFAAIIIFTILSIFRLSQFLETIPLFMCCLVIYRQRRLGLKKHFSSLNDVQVWSTDLELIEQTRIGSGKKYQITKDQLEKIRKGESIKLIEDGQLILLGPLKNDDRIVGTTGISIDISKTLEEFEAEVATKAKAEFVTAMSHEIRNPLHGILQCLQLLSLSNLTKDQAEHVEDANSGTKVLEAIIRDVLDMSKIAGGQLQLASCPVNILDLIETEVEAISNSAHEKGVEVFTYVDPKIPMEALGDEKRLGQILNNFLSNAVAFSSNGGTILLKAEYIGETETHSKIRFNCTDCGIGIKKEDLHKVFQSFTKLHKKTGHKGWGLGLSVCKGLVNLMGGKIGVLSEYKKGSTFWFEVDLKKHDKNKQDRIINNLYESSFQNILVIHPKSQLKESIEPYLKAMKVKSIQFVNNEQDAIAKLTDKVDCVILDDKLSDKNKIKKHLNQRQKLIILSSNENLNNQEFDECPFQTIFIKKPVRLSRLTKALAGRKNSLLTSLIWDKEILNKLKFTGKTDLSVLVVEDNPVNQKVVVKLLQTFGIKNVSVANNGEEAVKKVVEKDGPFDIIIMDIQMPVVSILYFMDLDF